MDRPGGLVCLTTWNMQGSQDFDVAEAAARLRELASPYEIDVAVFQEVQRKQAARLGTELGMASRRWAFKHWPIRCPSEGLAVVTSHHLARTRSVTVRRARWWNWRRRVVLLAEVRLPSDTIVVADVHLSAEHAAEQRDVEVVRLQNALKRFDAERAAVVAGDFNDWPGSAVVIAMSAAGWRDAWAECHDDEPGAQGATNWSPGDRTGRSPDQRIDFVFVPLGWEVVDIRIGAPSGADGSYQQWAEISDHLPVCCVLRPS